MNLLVDIGNTRLKWGVSINGRIVSGAPLSNTEVSRQSLSDAWKECSPPRHIALACVSSEIIAGLVYSVALELWPETKIIRVKSQAHSFGVTNAYLKPEKLGVDRWLSLVAVRHHYPLPACIVDFGTAITIDLIDEQGRHQGGMICPGLTLMKKSLSAGTEALTFNESRYQLGPANATDAAINSGVLTAVIGLVEHVFAERPKTSTLISTGGDADLVSEHLVYKSIVDPDLVLRGLAIVLTGSV